MGVAQRQSPTQPCVAVGKFVRTRCASAAGIGRTRLESIVARAAEGLGVNEPVTAMFYKLLVYDRGSFFVSHRDTEKSPGMFATLLVALPSPFAGGELIVRHKDREVHLDLRADDPAEIGFAAFYADCVHEVLPRHRRMPPHSGLQPRSQRPWPHARAAGLRTRAGAHDRAAPGLACRRIGA